MKILSIDVGIKNLSFCLFELQSPEEKSNHLKVSKWDNIDLSEKTESRCVEVDKNGLCDKPAKFSKDGKCYCLKHSKKHNYLQPSPQLKPSYLNKQKIQNLMDIADKYKLTYEKPPKKANILGIINEFINNKPDQRPDARLYEMVIMVFGTGHDGSPMCFVGASLAGPPCCRTRESDDCP